MEQQRVSIMRDGTSEINNKSAFYSQPSHLYKMAENGDQEEFSYTEEAGEGDTFGDDGLGGDDETSTAANRAGDTGARHEDEDGEATHGEESMVEDPELERIKARVREMEEEAEKLKEMQSEVDKQMNLSSSSITSPPKFPTKEEKMEADAKSIYVGNVDYGATAEELEQHFHGCGSINRVTILCDKFSGHPKGFAYVEFADMYSVQTATALDESMFRGRQIKVSAKRTNMPGISSTDRGRGRGRGGRGRGAAAAAAAAAAYLAAVSGFLPYGGGYAPRGSRGRGAYRGRRNFYSPY